MQADNDAARMIEQVRELQAAKVGAIVVAPSIPLLWRPFCGMSWRPVPTSGASCPRPPPRS